VLGILVLFNVVSPASATIKAENYKTASVPGTSNIMTGRVLIDLDSSNVVTIYGTTYLNGFYEGTAPVDSLRLDLTACEQGGCKSTYVTRNKGSNSPYYIFNLGTNNGGSLYEAKGTHRAYKSG